jgi:hypothetical protein
MDSSSFTKTSFCGSEIDNITTNESKKFILDKLNLLCSLNYNSRYAKVYNDKYSNNLKNPHLFHLKSSGTPYLLFITEINETRYSFLIDKKKKSDYDYPKIFILPYQFSEDIYKGSLFECELIRDNNNKWSIGINDIYYYKGINLKNKIIIDRVNIIHDILLNNFIKNYFLNTCNLFIKRYFDYKDIDYVLNEFIPNLSYDIRGLYLIPINCKHSNILYLFEKNTIKNNKNSKYKIFRIIKTINPDIYDLYLSDNDNNLIKQGLALVQDYETSKLLITKFNNINNNDELYVKCEYDNIFKKWKPLEFIDGPCSKI